MTSAAPKVVQEPRGLTPEDVSDRMGALETTYRRPDSAGVAVVDGFAYRIVVERGALEVSDGVGPHRRERRYDKAERAYERASLRDRPAARKALDDARKACYAALRGEA